MYSVVHTLRYTLRLLTTLPPRSTSLATGEALKRSVGAWLAKQGPAAGSTGLTRRSAARSHGAHTNACPLCAALVGIRPAVAATDGREDVRAELWHRRTRTGRPAAGPRAVRAHTTLRVRRACRTTRGRTGNIHPGGTRKTRIVVGSTVAAAHGRDDARAEVGPERTHPSRTTRGGLAEHSRPGAVTVGRTAPGCVRGSECVSRSRSIGLGECIDRGVLSRLHRVRIRSRERIARRRPRVRVREAHIRCEGIAAHPRIRLIRGGASRGCECEKNRKEAKRAIEVIHALIVHR